MADRKQGAGLSSGSSAAVLCIRPIVGLKNAIYKFNPTAGFVHI